MNAGDEKGREANSKLSDIPHLVLEPRRLLELLHICTLITQGQGPLFSVHCKNVCVRCSEGIIAPKSLNELSLFSAKIFHILEVFWSLNVLVKHVKKNV